MPPDSGRTARLRLVTAANGRTAQPGWHRPRWAAPGLPGHPATHKVRLHASASPRITSRHWQQAVGWSRPGAGGMTAATTGLAAQQQAGRASPAHWGVACPAHRSSVWGDAGPCPAGDSYPTGRYGGGQACQICGAGLEVGVGGCRAGDAGRVAWGGGSLQGCWRGLPAWGAPAVDRPRHQRQRRRARWRRRRGRWPVEACRCSRTMSA
jgi:hypothetical protein